MLDSETGAQQIGEQPVVAVPAALVVERHEEEVRPLDLLEHGLAIGAGPVSRVAQRSRQPVQHRRPQQEVANFRIEAREDLLGDEVQDEAVGRGEFVHVA